MKHAVIFLLIVGLLNQGDALRRRRKSKPGNCPSTGMFTPCVCSPLPSECTTDFDCRGKRKCCSLACDCRRYCVPPGDCYYNGKSYLIGQTYPSTDGCNTCTCTSDRISSCTERACVGYPGR